MIRVIQNHPSLHVADVSGIQVQNDALSSSLWYKPATDEAAQVTCSLSGCKSTSGEGITLPGFEIGLLLCVSSTLVAVLSNFTRLLRIEDVNDAARTNHLRY